MDTIDKAEANLANKDISSRSENSTLYVCIGETMLELSEFEIEYQAKEYDKNNS